MNALPTVPEAEKDKFVGPPDTSVTLNHKRYIFVCCGCDLLAESSRSDALTCSGACRVRAHRSGIKKELRNLARMVGLVSDDGKLLVAGIKQAEAIKRLRPDLYVDLEAGTLTLTQAQPEMYRSYIELLYRQVRGEVS